MVSLYNCLDMTFSCVWEEIFFFAFEQNEGMFDSICSGLHSETDVM